MENRQLLISDGELFYSIPDLDSFLTASKEQIVAVYKTTYIDMLINRGLQQLIEAKKVEKIEDFDFPFADIEYTLEKIKNSGAVSEEDIAKIEEEFKDVIKSIAE